MTFLRDHPNLRLPPADATSAALTGRERPQRFDVVYHVLTL